MDAILILSSARKAVLARLHSLNRHFCADDIDEMVGMTVERFYTKGHYDPSRSSVQTYVGRIALNVVYDFVKAADRERLRTVCLDALLDAGPDSSERLKNDPTRNRWFTDDCGADTRLLAEEEEALVERTKNRLGSRDRECYDLLAGGKSHEEIARLKGTTVGNVGVVAHRMRIRFRTLFEEVA